MTSKDYLKVLDKIRKEATGKTSLTSNAISDQDRLLMKQELYNIYSREYERRTEGGLFLFKRELDVFASATRGLKVMDLGSGPGRDARYLNMRGTHALCVDFSAEMLERCSAKGLETNLLNYESELSKFGEGSFDGLWTNCSLTTTPQSKIKNILNEVYRILKPNSPVFFGFIESDKYDEGWINPDWKYNIPRFRFRADRKHIGKFLESSGFKIVGFNVVLKEISGKNTYLKYLCLKGEKC